MEWFGHIWGADDIIIKVLTETIHKKIPIGRPRMRRKDAVEKDIKMLGRNVTVQQLTWLWAGKDGENCLWQLRSYRDS